MKGECSYSLLCCSLVFVIDGLSETGFFRSITLEKCEITFLVKVIYLRGIVALRPATTSIP